MATPPDWVQARLDDDEVEPGVPQPVRDAVRSHFAPYEAHEDDFIGTYYVHEEAGEIEERFNQLLEAIDSEGYACAIREEGGERVLNVFPQPGPPERKEWVNWALFLGTWLTTTLAGAFAVFGYRNPGFCFECYGADAALLPLGREFMIGGFVLFALPLMLILGVHEMGHYIAGKRHGLTPSFPYFIPLPPVFAVNIGTLGAFISLREPIPDKKALFDIGASGPLAGLVVAIPVTLLGAFLMAVDPVRTAQEGATVMLGTPLLFDALAWPFDIAADAIIHPVAMAGWVGLLVTGINLIPSGQLDGGHIAASLVGEKAQTLSLIALAGLVLLGMGIPPFSPDQWIEGYGGWLVFALIILFLGARHPPTLNSVTKLDDKRALLAIGTLLLIFVTFIPTPITGL